MGLDKVGGLVGGAFGVAMGVFVEVIATVGAEALASGFIAIASDVGVVAAVLKAKKPPAAANNIAEKIIIKTNLFFTGHLLFQMKFDAVYTLPEILRFVNSQ